MNKNKILLVIAMTGLVIVSSLYVQIFPVNSLLTANAECTEDDKSEKIQIAHELFRNFIYEQNAIYDKAEKCDDFIITNVEIAESHNNSFTAKIIYDIKSNEYNSVWLAGNGIKQENGWIRNKSNFITIEKSENGYAIKNIFT